MFEWGFELCVFDCRFAVAPKSLRCLLWQGGGRQQRGRNLQMALWLGHVAQGSSHHAEICGAVRAPPRCQVSAPSAAAGRAHVPWATGAIRRSFLNLRIFFLIVNPELCFWIRAQGSRFCRLFSNPERVCSSQLSIPSSIAEPFF